MKYPPIILFILLACNLVSFRPKQACEYAGSNISYVKTQTEKAFDMQTLELTRFHIYKGLGAIAKSKEQLEDCGCAQASDFIYEADKLLKSATKTTTLAGTRALLGEALENTNEGLKALIGHERHGSRYGTGQLRVNTVSGEKLDTLPAPPDQDLLTKKIDSALGAYRKSLQKVIATVDCETARSFASETYQDCEEKLLQPDLSERKKYYYFRTKEITAEALEQLGNCE